MSEPCGCLESGSGCLVFVCMHIHNSHQQTRASSKIPLPGEKKTFLFCDTDTARSKTCSIQVGRFLRRFTTGTFSVSLNTTLKFIAQCLCHVLVGRKCSLVSVHDVANVPLVNHCFCTRHWFSFDKMTKKHFFSVTEGTQW